MNILISNDDGVDAPGIIALADTIKDLACVTVVAPDKNRSGSSSALTLDRPLRCEKNSRGHFRVTGTPCDCIHLGTHRLMINSPDMVIAGINRGANLGDDVLYSGTVAAAMEGRSLGFPAVAISLVGRKNLHYKTAANFMGKLLQLLQKHPLDPSMILNVNVPDLDDSEIKGIELTRLGSRHRADTIVTSIDPRGETVYWIGPPSEPQDVGKGTDFAAVERGYISITPLMIDLTASLSMQSMTSWIEKF
ncbi:MAG: 5'/3'-nucleotidase SurE [Kangiellaceae bacterium]|nr:5'/3'-nucleotidase SurE [Kangiellaceae bacterium]